MGLPFFVYQLRCADGSYYVGHTDDLERRLAEHGEGGKCKYTETRRPVTLAWFQEVATRDEAKEAEVRLKGWSRAKKEALIAGRVDALRAAAKKQDCEGYRRRKARPPSSSRGRFPFPSSHRTGLVGLTSGSSGC